MMNYGILESIKDLHSISSFKLSRVVVFVVSNAVDIVPRQQSLDIISVYIRSLKLRRGRKFTLDDSK